MGDWFTKAREHGRPVNLQFHSEFVALCALFYLDEISEEEWAVLQIHMAYCDSCHKRFLDFQRITSGLD